MDIDGQLGIAQEAERQAAAESRRKSEDVKDATAKLRHAFGDFHAALIRHGVPPLHFIRLEKETMPFLRQIFTTSTSRLKAIPSGKGWNFYGNLLFEDGSIAGWSYGAAGIGRRVIPDGAFHKSFGGEGREALRRAGLGEDFSDEHCYVRDDKPFVQLDWDAVPGTSWAGGVELRLHSNLYALRDGQLFIKLDDGHQNATEVPLVREFAKIINSGGR